MKYVALLQQTAALEPSGPLQLPLLSHPLLLPQNPILPLVADLALPALVQPLQQTGRDGHVSISFLSATMCSSKKLHFSVPSLSLQHLFNPMLPRQ
jgi:hypothetical protein